MSKYDNAGSRNGVIRGQIALWSGLGAAPSRRSRGSCTWSLRWPALGPTWNAPFGVSKRLPGPFWPGWSWLKRPFGGSKQRRERSWRSQGTKSDKIPAFSVLGRLLCSHPWPVRMLKSDEGFGKFPLHLTTQAPYLILPYYTRRVLLLLLRRHTPPPPPGTPGDLQATPRGGILTKILVFWWTPVCRNMTMPGPETELYGVK